MKKRRILKTGLLGTQKKQNDSKIAGKQPFVFFSPNKNHYEKTKQPPNNKKQTKTPFCMLANTPLFLVNVCFFKLHSFISARLCFVESTIKKVFSAEHGFQVSQIVKPLLRNLPKMALLKPKVPFWVSLVPAETPIFVVCGGFEWAQKRTIFQKQIVATKIRFFLPNTNSVCLFFKKSHFCKKNIFFVQNHPKTLFFCFVLKCLFSMFFIFALFLSPT